MEHSQWKLPEVALNDTRIELQSYVESLATAVLSISHQWETRKWELYIPSWMAPYICWPWRLWHCCRNIRRVLRTTQTAGRALWMRLLLDWGPLNTLQIITNCHKSLQVEYIAPLLSNLTLMTTMSNSVSAMAHTLRLRQIIALMAMLS